MSFDFTPSGPARLIFQKAGYDGGWTLQPEGTIPAALDDPPWMTLRSQNVPGQIALAIAPPGYALHSTPRVQRRLAEEGLGTPEGDHLRFAELAALRTACLRAWHLFRALPDAPEAAFEADLKRQGQSWSGPNSHDLDPTRATTREAQVRLRVGQSTFRAALDDYWNGRCPLTGITQPHRAVASFSAAKPALAEAGRYLWECPVRAENANHVWADTRGRKAGLLCERKAIMPLR